LIAKYFSTVFYFVKWVNIGVDVGVESIGQKFRGFMVAFTGGAEVSIGIIFPPCLP